MTHTIQRFRFVELQTRTWDDDREDCVNRDALAYVRTQKLRDHNVEHECARSERSHFRTQVATLVPRAPAYQKYVLHLWRWVRTSTDRCVRYDYHRWLIPGCANMCETNLGGANSAKINLP